MARVLLLGRAQARLRERCCPSCHEGERLQHAVSSPEPMAFAAIEREFSAWGWRFTAQRADFSIDAVAEEVTGSYLTGRLVALVLKAGDSFFREPVTGGWLFRGDNAHLL